MTEEKDLKTIPMEELTQMVSWMTIWDAEQLSTGKGWDDTSTKDSKESDTNDSDNSGDSNHFDKGEEQKEVEQQTDAEQEPKEKRTPEGVKKLLHQRSELRQERDRLQAELDEANELIRKLRSWELDEEFKNSEWEVDLERKEEAIQDATFNSKIIEREYKNSNRNLDTSRDWELAKFFIENPDLWDVKDDIVEYANKHKDLDIEDIRYLVLSKIDPTRLLDEQTKHKLQWGYDISWTDYTWPKEKDKDIKDMSNKELLSKIEELGIL